MDHYPSSVSLVIKESDLTGVQPAILKKIVKINKPTLLGLRRSD
jgi:hypothetical protein